MDTVTSNVIPASVDEAASTRKERRRSMRMRAQKISHELFLAGCNGTAPRLTRHERRSIAWSAAKAEINKGQ